ncbi:MAG: bifunctional transaldolase/phosoglucose isomerase [Gammaproteobacteria bacterium]|nr:bifunctional transaldolase/phosoglucose isomerase [Gammaproteobacteria bacterium]
MNPLQELNALGQSLWLDNIRRGLLDSGTLKRYIDELAVTGLTSNPTIFEHAIMGSRDYDAALKARLGEGVTAEDVFFELAIEDLRAAADLLRPVYQRTQGTDGFVSLEVSPRLAEDTRGTIDQAQKLHARADRPNLLIKVPGTSEGLPASEELIFEGVPVNVTLLFSAEHYLAAAEAYLRGIERRIKSGRDPAVPSVASLFISRWDTASAAALHNRLGLAVAAATYHAYRELYSSARWQRLAGQGARPQKLLWASTGTKDPKLPDTYYVTALAVPDTINTLPEPTLLAYAHHGTRGDLPSLGEVEKTLDLAAAADIDLATLAAKLQNKGRDAFVASFDALLKGIETKRRALREASLPEREALGALAAPVEQAVGALADASVAQRLWRMDHTLWQERPTEITNRLDWLISPQEMLERLDEMNAFAAEVHDAGYTHVLWCGMGGSSLFPQVLQHAFGVKAKGPALTVLDTSHPAAVARAARDLPPQHTLYVFASKSGGTLETRCQLDYFWQIIPDPSHYAVITDQGSGLDRLAQERGFRRVFHNNPNLGGRYSALSHFGLVAGALLGVDLRELLTRAQYMASSAMPCVAARDNPALRLGAVLGTAARHGRDKCTLLMPNEIGAFGAWLEQLIAESTGKQGRGILPVVDEPLGAPDVYGDDRLFIALGDDAGLERLERAGQPVVRLPYTDGYSIGAEVFRWEFAVAVAGRMLGINPFDQPDVEAAKHAANQGLTQGLAQIPEEPLENLLAQINAGDYIALQAYIDPDSAALPALQRVRVALRDRYRVATTLGVGPRYLHSTGQLHKGGADNGVFIQVLDDPGPELPIPGRDYGFRKLIEAQAAGDYLALKARGRRVARVKLAALLAECRLG